MTWLRGLTPVLAGVLLLAGLSRPARAQAERPSGIRAVPGVQVDIAARSVAPGELLLVTIGLQEPATAVQVTAFDRHAAATDLGDRRWQALLGIDLDQPPGRYTLVVEVEGPDQTHQVSRPVVVEPKAFPTRVLKVDPSFVSPTPAQLARIEADRAWLRDVFASSVASRYWHDLFVRPVPGRASGRFGARSVFNGEPRAPHGGTDLLSPAGTPIRAPNAGRVVGARDLYFTGRTVIIDHGLGVFSMLAHLSRLDVREGDVVAVGQVVGLVGATGRVTGPHLHWAVSVGGARVDPLSVLALVGAKPASGR